MVARDVVPEMNGLLDDYREAFKWANDSRAVWARADETVDTKIQQHESASEVMRTEGFEGEKSAAENSPAS